MVIGRERERTIKSRVKPFFSDCVLLHRLLWWQRPAWLAVGKESEYQINKCMEKLVCWTWWVKPSHSSYIPEKIHIVDAFTVYWIMFINETTKLRTLLLSQVTLCRHWPYNSRLVIKVYVVCYLGQTWDWLFYLKLLTNMVINCVRVHRCWFYHFYWHLQSSWWYESTKVMLKLRQWGLPECFERISSIHPSIYPSKN